ERRAARAGTRRPGGRRGTVPGTAAALAPPAASRALRRAGGTRRQAARRAGGASERRGRRAARAGRETRLAARSGWGRPARAWTTAGRRAGRGAGVPRGGRERADPAAGLRRAPRTAS